MPSRREQWRQRREAAEPFAGDWSNRYATVPWRQVWQRRLDRGRVGGLRVAFNQSWFAEPSENLWQALFPKSELDRDRDKPSAMRRVTASAGEAVGEVRKAGHQFALRIANVGKSPSGVIQIATLG